MRKASSIGRAFFLALCRRSQEKARKMSDQAAAPEVMRSQGFELVDGTGKVRAMLALLADGRPGFLLYDKEGEVIWQAP
jgi:hypothetical protein